LHQDGTISLDNTDEFFFAALILTRNKIALTPVRGGPSLNLNGQASGGEKGYDNLISFDHFSRHKFALLDDLAGEDGAASDLAHHFRLVSTWQTAQL